MGRWQEKKTTYIFIYLLKTAKAIVIVPDAASPSTEPCVAQGRKVLEYIFPGWPIWDLKLASTPEKLKLHGWVKYS